MRKNYIIIPNKKNKSYQNSFLLEGNLHYNFNKNNFQTLSNTENKLSQITLVLLNKNKYFIGLAYDLVLGTPMIIMKGTDIAFIKKYCKENYIQIVSNESLVESLNKHAKNDYIPQETYVEVAKIIFKTQKKIMNLSMLYVYKRKLAVGLNIEKVKNGKYKSRLSFKAKNKIQDIIDICKESKIPIKYHKGITEMLFYEYKINTEFEEE